MSKFIGIDIAKETFETVFLSEQGTEHFSFANNQSGFKQLLKKLGIEDKVIMEASGPYYLNLAHFLHEHGIYVSVVNPLIIRRFCQMRMMRAKTDRKDAAMIAAYGRQEKPLQWHPGLEVITKLKQLNTGIDLLDKQITSIKNQLEALSQMPIIERQLIKSLKSVLNKLVKEKLHLEEQVEARVKEHYIDSYTALQTIPGIGPKAATMLIIVTGNFSKFEHVRQLISYVGLSPRVFESGTSVKGKGRICKMGMSRVRKILYMCSWTAKSCNVHCKAFYDRLKSKGKAERVIKIAIANKLLRQAFAIGKSLKNFDKNYQSEFVF